jgi:hypothetical protein
MTKQEAIDAVNKYGSQTTAGKALHVDRKTIARALAADGAVAAHAEKRVGKSLADFRQTYDKATIIPAKVKTALAALGAGAWEYEVQFAKIAGVSLSDLGTFRDQFAAYVVTLREGRRAWAGTAATAKQMREMI